MNGKSGEILLGVFRNRIIRIKVNHYIKKSYMKFNRKSETYLSEYINWKRLCQYEHTFIGYY